MSESLTAEEFYNRLVLNFPQERRIIADYSKLVAPDHNEMHSLSWSDRNVAYDTASVFETISPRIHSILVLYMLFVHCFNPDKIEDIELSNMEVQKLDDEISDLKKQYESIQQEITNIKISQTMRRSQIARLSGLSQPIEFDQTYFFTNRHPDETTPRVPTKEQLGQNAAARITTSQMRTGDTVILESRLDAVSKLIQGQLNAFSTKLSSINLNETTTALNISTKRIKLRQEASDILVQLEKTESQLFATIVELLCLRLRMMKAQREEVELKELLKNEAEQFKRKEQTILSDLDFQLRENKRKFERDLSSQMHKYQRQLDKSCKKLRALDSYDQKKATEKKDKKLLDQLEYSKTRYEKLCQRHDLELEGYANEAKSLRRKLKQAQRAISLLS